VTSTTTRDHAYVGFQDTAAEMLEFMSDAILDLDMLRFRAVVKASSNCVAAAS
jgi:hypothetical protein